MRFLSRRRTGPAEGVLAARQRSREALRRASVVQELEERRLFAAELVVTSTPVPAQTVDAGGVITYTVTVRNTGTDFASNVVLTDTFSTAAEQNRATLQSVTYLGGPQFTPDPRVNNTDPLVLRIGQLNSGLASTYEIRLLVNPATAENTQVTNTAQVTFDGTDNPSDNIDTDVTIVSARADVQVTKVQEDVTGAPAPVLPGHVVAGLNVSYLLTVRNAGPSIARNVVLTDVVPALTSYVSFVQTSPGAQWSIPAGPGQPPLPAVGQSGTVSAAIAALNPGDTATFRLTVKVASNAPDSDKVTNTGVVDSTTFDPARGNNLAPVTSEIDIQTDVLIVSTPDKVNPLIEGTLFPYTVSIYNRGPSDAQGVSFVWTTPNFPNGAGELGVWYRQFDGPPVQHVSGLTFNISIPADPPQPRGNFGGSISTLPAGAGSTYQFFVGSAEQQDFVQKSSIKTSSPDYDPTNDDYTDTTHVYDAPLVVQQVPNIQGNAGQPLAVETVLFTDTNNWPGNRFTPDFNTLGGRAYELPDFSATINWGDGTTTAGVVAVDSTGTYRVSGQHTYAAQGAYPVRTLVVGDGESTAIGDSVALIGAAPRGVVQLGGLEFTENVQETKKVGVFSRGNGPATGYSVTINWGDGTSSVGTLTPNGANAFDIIGSHKYVDEGTYNGTVSVLGSDGITNSGPMVVVVKDRAVTIAPVNVSGQTGVPLTNVAVATFKDPGGSEAPGTYTANIDWGDNTGASVGTVTYDAATDTFTVSGNHTYANAGNFNMTVTVNHGTAPAATANPVASITDGPPNVQVDATPVNVAAVVNVPLNNVVVATFTDPGTDGAVSEYSAVIDWGDNTPTSTGTITYNATTQVYTVTGSHTYAAAGTFNMTVDIKHGNSPTETVNPTATVTTTPTGPAVVATKVDVTAQVNVAATNVVVATFTDPGPDGPVGNYSAVIDWGDNTPTSPGTITYNQATQVYTVTGTHTFATTGTFNMTVTITEAGSPPDVVVNPTATVTNTPPVPPVVATKVDVSATRNVALNNVPVATFTDPGPDGPVGNYTAVIDWGDGTPTSTGTITYDNASQVYTVTGSHTYTSAGTFNMTVTIDETGSPPPVVVTPTATVFSEFPVVGQPVAISASAGVPATNVVVATFTDPGQDLPVGSYDATINWGDGTPPSAGTITYDPVTQTYSVLGTHTFVATGTYGVTVTIGRTNAADSVVTSTATVSIAADVTSTTPVSFTGVEGKALTNVIVGRFSSRSNAATVSDFTALINWGDGTTTAGTIVRAPTQTGGGTGQTTADFNVTGSHTYRDDGRYTLTVVISSVAQPGSGTAVTPASTASITDAPLNGISRLISAQRNSQFSGMIAQVVDGNIFDTNPGEKSVRIDWGDGSTPTAGTVSYNASLGRFEINGSHTYTAASPAGGFLLQITVRDGLQFVDITSTAKVS